MKLQNTKGGVQCQEAVIKIYRVRFKDAEAARKKEVCLFEAGGFAKNYLVYMRCGLDCTTASREICSQKIS